MAIQLRTSEVSRRTCRLPGQRLTNGAAKSAAERVEGNLRVAPCRREPVNL